MLAARIPALPDWLAGSKCMWLVVLLAGWLAPVIGIQVVAYRVPIPHNARGRSGMLGSRQRIHRAKTHCGAG